MYLKGHVRLSPHNSDLLRDQRIATWQWFNKNNSNNKVNENFHRKYHDRGMTFGFTNISIKMKGSDNSNLFRTRTCQKPVVCCYLKFCSSMGQQVIKDGGGSKTEGSKTKKRGDIKNYYKR